MCSVLLISWFQVELMVVCLFATSENGVVIQDSFAMSPALNRIIGMDTPYFFFMKKVSIITARIRSMGKATFLQFCGLHIFCPFAYLFFTVRRDEEGLWYRWRFFTITRRGVWCWQRVWVPTHHSETNNEGLRRSGELGQKRQGRHDEFQLLSYHRKYGWGF